MKISISSNEISFIGINTYQPPDWLNEAIQYAVQELGESDYYIEGNNDTHEIRVVFSECFEVSEDQCEKLEKQLEEFGKNHV